MTEKVINSSATGLLVLIIPLAILIVVLFKAWPIILAVFLISLALRIWQQYQWQQWSKQVNPYFNQLIKDNQGCLTPLDLSLKANLTGSAAQQFLERKAEEFGAQRRYYEDKGTVYYFLTASALGSIFENSEPEPDLEEDEEEVVSPTTKLMAALKQRESEQLEHKEEVSPTSKLIEALKQREPEELEHQEVVSPTSKLVEALKQTEPDDSESPSSTSEAQEPLESLAPEPPISATGTALTDKVEVEPELEKQPESEQKEALTKEEELSEESADQEEKPSFALIQAELAKRLDVHSSTVGKRKSDPDFWEWSQSRDPEGIAWEYRSDTKEFVPLEKIPDLE